MTPESDILNPTEVAAFIRLPVTTVRELLRRRELPGVLIGRRWRTRRSDLDALLAGGALPTTNAAATEEPAAPPPFRITSAPALGRPGRPRKKRRIRERAETTT